MKPKIRYKSAKYNQFKINATAFLNDCWKDGFYTPSMNEIAKKLGKAPSITMNYIHHMEDDGLVVIRRNRIYTSKNYEALVDLARTGRI